MADLNSMINALGNSLYPIQRLVSGIAYLMGIYFFIKALDKLRDASNKHGTSAGKGTLLAPLALIGLAATLLFLPTMLDVFRNSLFGANSPLAYDSWFNDLMQKYGNASYVITLFVQTAGVIWFVRGCILLIHATEPGSQHGYKGFAFLLAGIFAINFLYTANLVESSVNYFVSTMHALYPIVQTTTGNSGS